MTYEVHQEDENTCDSEAEEVHGDDNCEPRAAKCKVAIKLIRIDGKVICVEFMRLRGAQIVFQNHF